MIYDMFTSTSISGLCAVVSLILPVQIFPMSADQLLVEVNMPKPVSQETVNRRRRTVMGLSEHDPTYIDAIGVPCGVPDEYKLVDQVAAGFESSFCWWCTINKNVDRINYIHYNVQRLGNLTHKGFEAVHQQLKATSLMAFQNRIAVDMLLAEKGGVCSIFGDTCCTFIPNNTAMDGSLTLAMDGLRTLNKKMKDHSGVDTTMWDKWMDMFGRYKGLVSSVFLSIAVFAALLTLCGCCCIPCIRSLLNRVITTAIEDRGTVQQRMPLLQVNNDDNEDYNNPLPHDDSDTPGGVD